MVDDAPRILGGRYEVGEIIGRGGMAEVHIGQDTRLGRTVAIKILRSDLARDPSFQARFRREAQAAASLNHPSIVAVYDTGEDIYTEVNGSVAHVPFIVMEYVEGHTVRDILRDGAAVPIEEAVEITAGVLSALEYSHHAGIVHRDIKPANVMLTPTGAVKVMDFGIARAMADAAGTMTQTQAVIGTAQYLSPEQARGEQVDARSDLYSTGCLLFELLTGRPPFIGDSPVAVAYQHAREEAQAPSTFASDVPDTLDRITMKALAKDRDSRYSTAAEFRSDLESAIRGGHVTAPAVGALAAAGAASLSEGPASAATQVLGAAGPVTQAMPAAAAWSQVRPDQRAPQRPVQADPQDDEPRGRGLMWALIAIAVLAVIGIGLILALGNRGETEPELVELGDLRGMEEAQALAAVDGLGLVPKKLTEASELDDGLVVRTNPQGPAEVEVGTEVEVVISSGPDAVTIPDLTNQSQKQASDALIALGFAAPSIVTENSPDVGKDKVTRTEPLAGTSVSPDTAVTVYLSTGQVELTDLVGQPRADAEAAVTALGLIPIVTEEESDAAVGTVIRQSRAPGPVPQRQTIELVVAIARTPEKTTVPNIEGLSWDQVLTAMGAAGLNAENAGTETSTTVAKDRATRSEPGAGQPVDVGSTVKVWMSSGPEAVPTPAPGDKGGG